MNRSPPVWAATILCLSMPVLLFASKVSPETYPKAEYSLKASTTGMAGGSTSNGSYKFRGTLGQPSAVGECRLDRRAALMGYWSIGEYYGGLSDVPIATPLRNRLYRNYPNPFNPITKICYTVGKQGLVSLVVYDLRGRRVNTLAHQVMRPGRYTATWAGRDDLGKTVASGIYLYRLKTNDYDRVFKMLLLK